MAVSTFMSIRNEPRATHVVVIDAAGKRVLAPTPLTVVGNLGFAFAPLPVDQGPLLSVFTSDAGGLTVLNECPVQEPNYTAPAVTVGAWLVRDGLLVVNQA